MTGRAWDSRNEHCYENVMRVVRSVVRDGYARHSTRDILRCTLAVGQHKELRQTYSSYAQLTAMLDQGWQIEPPVYIRPRRRSRSKKENTYHFVLWRDDRVNLVSVLDCPEIQQFLADNRLAIDCL